MQIKYDRAVSTSLSTLIYLIATFSKEENKELQNKYQELLNDKKFWNFSKHKNSMVRRCLYRFISTTSQKFPGANFFF